MSYLRPSGIDAARHAWAIPSLLVRALRARWPKVEIVFRGDSGFCRWRMLRWCENHGVRYIVGIAKNSRLRGPSGGGSPGDRRATVYCVRIIRAGTDLCGGMYFDDQMSPKRHERGRDLIDM